MVVTGRDEKFGDETVEVVHEALIREWLTLRSWMKKDRLFRAWQERIRAAIHQWSDVKQDEGALLRGVSLAEAEEKLKERREELSPSEQNFIQLSIELRDRQLREQKTRKLRGIVGVSGAGLVIITTLGLTAWNRSEQAKINSDKSRVNALALVDAEKGDNEKALYKLKRALHLDYKDAYTYYSLGTVKFYSGDKKGALDDYSQALLIDPKFDVAYNDRGNLRANLGNNKGALEDYNQSLLLNTKNPYTYNTRGRLPN